MTKIRAQPPDSSDHPEGMSKFREMISVRLASAEATEAEVFKTNAERDDLIRLTGGQPTELMTLIREAIVTEGLPIGEKGVKRSRIEAMRSYRRQLRQDHWPLIEEARRTGQIVPSVENESAFRDLLDSRALLLYMNDDEWYGVNPALDGLTAPEPPPAKA